VRIGIALLSLSCSVVLAAEPKQWNFAVFLDQREIGTHRFIVTPLANDSSRMESHAAFRVRVLGLNAYRYVHDATEQWSGGCLRGITSRTNDDGKTFQVDGDSTPAGLVVKKIVNGSQSSSTLAGCISTFAYWDAPLLLKQKQLVNSQTGEQLAVTIVALEPGTADAGGQKIALRRYRITAQGMDITLGYASEGGEWVSLESAVKGGRHLRYVRR
jgi:Family of unknown function (DUF6134)